MSAATATLITCHANADFDAFAAMLAARHLYAPCMLLFPGSQERGLQKVYANLNPAAYGFAEAADLRWEDFDRLVLVDTRQRSRVGHVAPLLERPGIRIEAWDHHPDSPDDIAATRYRTSFYNRYFKRFKAPESWFYPGALLKDKTKMFIARSNCDVGVFINRNFVKATNTLVVISSEEDLFLLDYTRTLLKATHGSVGIVAKMSTTTPGHDQILKELWDFVSSIPQTQLLPDKDLTPGLFNSYNFMLIGYNTWNDVSEHRKEALQKMPSTLILNKNKRSSSDN